MKRLLKKEESPKKGFVRAIKIVALAIVLFLILEIWMVNRLTTFGNKIEQLKDVQSQLQLKNQILENEIAGEISLAQIEEKSTSLGFDSVKNIKYINPQPLAMTN